MTMDDGRLTIGPRQSPAAILKSPDLIGTTQDLSRLLVRSISRRFQQLTGFFGPKKRGLRMTDRAFGAAAPGEFRSSSFELPVSFFQFLSSTRWLAQSAALWSGWTCKQPMRRALLGASQFPYANPPDTQYTRMGSGKPQRFLLVMRRSIFPRRRQVTCRPA